MGNAHQHGRAVGTGGRGGGNRKISKPYCNQGEDYAHHITIRHPRFSDLPTPTNMGTILISSVSFDTINSFSLILNVKF